MDFPTEYISSQNFNFRDRQSKSSRNGSSVTVTSSLIPPLSSRYLGASVFLSLLISLVGDRGYIMDNMDHGELNFIYA